jgi:hypothetical protein
VLDDVVGQLEPRGSIRRTTRSISPQYCRTVLSAAKFLSQLESAEEFYGWVASFDGLDERARPALPMLLDTEIAGLGFPLACGFIKELGYENFSKPDVHVKDIFWAIGLCPWGTSDYEVFKAVARVARNVGVTPYNVDKLFWLLIGSGNFYEDQDVGNGAGSAAGRGGLSRWPRGSWTRREVREHHARLDGRGSHGSIPPQLPPLGRRK